MGGPNSTLLQYLIPEKPKKLIISETLKWSKMGEISSVRDDLRRFWIVTVRSMDEKKMKSKKMDDKKFHDIYCRDIIPKVVHNRNLSKSKELKQKIWDEFIGELIEL